MLKLIILFAIGFFWFSILDALHKRKGYWAEWPISRELSGKFSNPVDLSFIGIGVAFILTPFAYGYGLRTGWAIIPDLIMFLAGISTVITMLSRKVWPDETIHLTAASITYAAAALGFALIALGLHSYVLAILAFVTIAPALVTVAANFKPLHLWLAKFSRIEWLTTSLLMAWLILATYWLP